MAELLITEAPGGIGDAYQCPFCGRMSLVKRLDDNGEPTDQDAETPRKCLRCGCPMDVTAALKFEEEEAVKAATPEASPRVRRTVKV